MPLLVPICALIISAAIVIETESARAECYCECVNGYVQALCTNAFEIRPICPPRICPIAPPAVEPIPRLRIPPIGTRVCHQEQIYNTYTRRYEWQEVCY